MVKQCILLYLTYKNMQQSQSNFISIHCRKFHNLVKGITSTHLDFNIGTQRRQQSSIAGVVYICSTSFEKFRLMMGIFSRLCKLQIASKIKLIFYLESAYQGRAALGPSKICSALLSVFNQEVPSCVCVRLQFYKYFNKEKLFSDFSFSIVVSKPSTTLWLFGHVSFSHSQADFPTFHYFV